MVAGQNRRTYRSRALAFTMWVLLLSSIAASSAYAEFALSITVAPPPLPVYVQPSIPEPGYIWTPGYWAYGPEGYFWVPGTWIEPPEVGFLWTPGYWGWANGFYVWNAGFWGPQIGFYGGVNYGYGYTGHGYEGGYWRGNQFYYNRSVNNVSDVHVTNVYNTTVVNNVTVNHVSYAGGPGGVSARPTAAEEQAAHVRHVPPTPQQTQHRDSAGSRRELLASVNQGKPPIAATARPADFSTHVVTASRAGGPVPAAVTHPNTETARPSQPTTAPHAAAEPASKPPVHASDLPRPAPAAALPESASSAERESARQQSQLLAKQEQERAALAQQQERDHANVRQQQANAQAAAAMERQHQQQTQQLQERHTNEQRSVSQAPPHAAAPPVAHTAAPAPHGAPPHEGSHQ
jgi:hypothetical protein